MHAQPYGVDLEALIESFGHGERWSLDKWHFDVFVSGSRDRALEFVSLMSPISFLRLESALIVDGGLCVLVC